MKTVYIYAIVRAENGDAYVGSSIDVAGRWRTHRYYLNKGNHHSQHLQRAWNKYGKAAFRFVVVDEKLCESKPDRVAFELDWISRAGAYNGMICQDGYFTSSEQTRNKLSATLRQKMLDIPEYQAWLQARGKAMAELAQTAEARKTMGERTKRRWTDPKERERLRAGVVARWAEPENRLIHSQKTSARVSTPEMRASHSEKMKAAWRDPEKRAKLDARQKSRWLSPDARRIQSEKLRAAWAKRKSRTENSPSSTV